MLRVLFSFLLLITVLAPAMLRAQSVGVVMSGGGAKGLYHIGVLQALEENGIPIDYVAGTSMGSIIGAMYAAGYSPAQMRAIVESGAVKEWVAGRIDPNYMPYYRQVKRLPSFFRLRVDLRKADPGRRFMIPTNLLSSTPVDMALLELFAPATAAANGNFDHLMVPFLCVASDMNARQPVVLRRGDLAEAVRSSMSIPLVFKPMKKGDKLLYDGGIYDNFPWKPMDESFAPDVIIGAICTEGNTAPSENNNLMDQAFVLAMHDTDYTLPEGRSVTVQRAVPAGMLDFDNATAIMDMGYQDAMEQMPQMLAAVAVRRDSSYYAERRAAFCAKSPELIFDNYEFTGLSRTQSDYVRDFVKVDTKGDGEGQRRMAISEFRDNLYGVLGSGELSMDFPHAKYDLSTGYYTFSAGMATRPNFKVLIGGNISSTAFNQVYIGFSYERIGRVAHALGADFYVGPIYNWGTLGGRTDFYAWKPLFLDYSFNFSSKNLRHGAFGIIAPVNNTLDIKETEAFLSVGVGMPVTHRSVLSLHVNGGISNFHYDNEKFVVDRTRLSHVGAKVELQRNTYDKPLYPRKGSYFSISAIGIIGRDQYQPFNVSEYTSTNRREWVGARFMWNKYFDIPSCSWFSFGFNIDALYTNEPRFSTDVASLMALPAYEPVQQMKMVFMPDFRARRFVAGGVMPTFDLLPNFFLRTGFYAMYRNKRDFVPQGFDNGVDERLHYVAEASLVYHTTIGPVSLSLTKYDLKNWDNMYLMFNFGYALFAPRGTYY